MSRPRFLANHDFNEHIIRGSKRLEPAIEFLKVREVGLSKGSDSEVLAYAAAENWLVVSHDVNSMSASAYARIKSGDSLSGLFLVHQSTPLARIIDDLILIWTASEAEEWADQVWFLPL